MARTCRRMMDVQRIDNGFVYSASDLNNFLECEHLIELERRVALRELERPEPDPSTALLARKGEEHEERHLERLREAYGNDLVAFGSKPERSATAFRAAESATVAAMEAGARIIYQATFFDGQFVGYADFLRRVERPCARWAWSYEAIDTKLALSPKPYYLIQLCNYSEHLERIQGTAPRNMHVVLGQGSERSFRVDDYSAYYRRIKATFLERMTTAPNNTYPFENGHCTICRWRVRCATQRDRDDHLSIVAFMRRDQIAKLEANGIATLAQLAQARDDQRPFGMAETSFQKLRAQAILQHHQRTTREHKYEFVDHDRGNGFELLPKPDKGDIFFDIEGDPLYSPERGLEYLFGVYLPLEGEYRAFWARNHAEERAAFEALVDFIVARRVSHPDMHVYHYASYEATALRRLMGFHATREREVDELLRSEALVDLYSVVRQALRISQPSYSIKKLEAFYGMKRSTEVQRGDDSIVMFESWLATGNQAILDDIERYNDDDCRSTHLLLEWLLWLRRQREKEIGPLAWRVPREQTQEEEASPSEPLARALLDGLQPPLSLHQLRTSNETVRARWLLGHLLEYHRREAKPAWWQLFDRYDNRDRLLEFDHEAIGELRLVEGVVPYKLKERDKNLVFTYEFPDQQHNLGTNSPYCPDARTAAGTIVDIDDERNIVRIKLSASIAPGALRALIPGGPIDTKAQRAALQRIASAYLAGTLESQYPATASILLGRRPVLRGRSDSALIQPAPVTREAISEIVRALDGSHLVIQGPPGTGKSTLGGEFIVDLLAAGKRVGIVSNGHKAIHNLLCKVETTALARGVSFTGLQKFSDDGSRYESPLEVPFVVPTANNKDFAETDHQLAAGTSWLFSRDDVTQRYDYLIVDEAGQMSLADVLACAPSAHNLVMLGDPLQLKQVAQGSHPLGTDLSVLQHLLGADDTIDPRSGIFLDVSYRMHPRICTFVSHAVYEDRLHAAPECARNVVDDGAIGGSGLRYLPVEHFGNRRASHEEAGAIVGAISALLGGTVTIGAADARRMTASDILVVSPYNAQRKRIRARLKEAGFADVRVGTVDKFQGQEAPVVFYSMATSSGADLPRDMEFLFEKNRLNVAISRARCLTALVSSPALLTIRCKQPEEMALVNLLCAFAEQAVEVLPASKTPEIRTL